MHSMDVNKTHGEKVDENYTRILRVVLNNPNATSTKWLLYGYLSPISKTIQVRRTRHAGCCWRSMDKCISSVLLCWPISKRTYISSVRTLVEVWKHLLGAMNDSERERETETERDTHRQREKVKALLSVFPS